MEFMQRLVKQESGMHPMLVAILVSFVTTLSFVLLLGAFLSPYIKALPDFSEEFVTALYPDDLEMEVGPGGMTANVEQPYEVGFSEEAIAIAANSDFDFLVEPLESLMDENYSLAVIDEEADLADFDLYETIVLVSGKGVAFPDDDGTFRIVSFRQIFEESTLDTDEFILIDKQFVTSSFAEFKAEIDNEDFSYVALAPVIIMLSIFFGMVMVFYLTVRYVYYGVVLWVVGQLLKKKIGFERLFHVSFNIAGTLDLIFAALAIVIFIANGPMSFFEFNFVPFRGWFMLGITVLLFIIGAKGLSEKDLGKKEENKIKSPIKK